MIPPINDRLWPLLRQSSPALPQIPPGFWSGLQKEAPPSMSRKGYSPMSTSESFPNLLSGCSLCVRPQTPAADGSVYAYGLSLRVATRLTIIVIQRGQYLASPKEILCHRTAVPVIMTLQPSALPGSLEGTFILQEGSTQDPSILICHICTIGALHLQVQLL